MIPASIIASQASLLARSAAHLSGLGAACVTGRGTTASSIIVANHEAYKAARTEVEAEAIFNLRMQAQTFLTVSKTTNVARDRQSRAAGGQAESIISNGGTLGSKQARARGQSGGTTVAEDEKGSGPWQRVHCLVCSDGV